MRSIALFLHLSGVVVWFGGMFFAHFFLRPVAAAQLPPAERLSLMSGVLGRFFIAVAAGIVAIFASGIAVMAATGFGRLPLSWHIMMGIGTVMAAIFLLIYFRHYVRLAACISAQDWPAAGDALNSIRVLVSTNLALGIAALAVATLGANL